jgi:uncharacterized protein
MASLRVWGIELSLGRRSDEDLLVAVARALAIHRDLIRSVRVVRRSLDARKGRFAPKWVCTVDIEAEGRPQRQPKGVRLGPIPEKPAPPSRPERRDLQGLKVAVVGTGPAGLFAALALGARGVEVTVLEQGAALKDRVSAVASLWRSGTLTGDANVQFGEGGAGTFSDGKLMTRVKDPLAREVLATFVECGAPEHILEEAHPHLGTDGVRSVVASLRQRIEAAGATFRFRAPVTAVETAGDGVRLIVDGGDLRADVAFLAVGHSSRTLFRALGAMGVPFAPKGFAVGVRVEHPQSWVDQCQYGRYAGHPDLPAAEYFLTHQDAESGRGVYSFCMCPGGLVVNSASEPEGLVTNGMSLSHRASGFANAGIVVTVSPDDFGGDPWLALDFQERLEREGYLLGGGGYRAPAQTLKSFLEGKLDEALPPTTFRPGATAADLRGFFPEWVEGPLARAFKAFDRKMPGFIEHGLLLAPETRTSSPLQVRRAADRSVEGFPRLNMVGEGAGWAGGIVSSAIDALRCVEAFGGR